MTGVLTKRVSIKTKDDGNEQGLIAEAINLAMIAIEKGGGEIITVVPTGYGELHRETFLKEVLIVYRQVSVAGVHEFGPPPRPRAEA